MSKKAYSPFTDPNRSEEWKDAQRSKGGQALRDKDPEHLKRIASRGGHAAKGKPRRKPWSQL